jgi:protein-tyrosine phosphatase
VIDLHCHILPGLDDGALDIDDAVGMARQADEDGIRTVCATPHIRHDHDVVIETLPSRVSELNAELERRGLTVRVAAGGEVAETALQGLEAAELHALTLGGGGRWLLLEPAPGPLADSLAEAAEELARRGIRSVIAHPERHWAPDLAVRLARLVDRGAIVQATAAMLEDERAAPTMVDLAERGLVHVLGSDSHSSRAGRPVRLSGAEAALRASAPLARHVDWMLHVAPAAILAGDDVEPPYPPAT